MSIWYDSNGKAYASDGNNGWTQKYIDKQIGSMNDELQTHFSGAGHRHGAEDVDYGSGETVKDVLDSKAPTDHSSASAEYGSATTALYGHVKLSDSVTSTSSANAGTAATPSAVKSAYDKAQSAEDQAQSTQTALTSKADKVTNGGFVAGNNASNASGGVAIGNYAKTTGAGAAIGSEAETASGFSGGYHAKSNGMGAAVGNSASAYHGGAVGYAANTSTGGAIGSEAKSTNGGAMGWEAVTGDGVAIGKTAKTVDTSNNAIDAVQLGTGTNNTAKTMQVYDKRIVEADGSLTDVGDLDELNTVDKTNAVAAINTIVSPKNNGAINLWIRNGQLGWDSYDLVDNEGHIFEERLALGVGEIVDTDYVNSKIDFDNIVPKDNFSSMIGTQTMPYGDVTTRRVLLQNTNGIEIGSSGIAITGDPVDVLLKTTALDVKLGDDYMIRENISEIKTNVGDPDNLNTSNKTNVVGAINEIVEKIVGVDAEYQLRFGDGSVPESDVMTETYEDGTTTYTGFSKYFAQPSSATDLLHIGTGIDVYKVEGMELTKIASSIDDDNINLTIQGLESACYGSGTFNELAIETYLMKADTYNYRANGFNLEGVNTLQTTDDNPVVETEDYIYVRLGTMKITDYYSEGVDYKYEITFTPNADVFGESESGNASAAIGDDTNYGIVKLNDSVNSTNDASDGTAATPAAVKAVYDTIPQTFFQTATIGGAEGGRTVTLTIDNFPTNPPSGTRVILNNQLTFEGSGTITLNINAKTYAVEKSLCAQFYTDVFKAMYPTFTYADGQFILTSFIPAIVYSSDSFYGLYGSGSV